MILGVSLGLFFISLLLITIVVVAFVCVPYFVRRKYINHLVKSIVIENDTVSLKTYRWFTYKSISASSKITEVEVEKSTSETFFDGKTVFILKLKDIEVDTFYIIEEFFDHTVSFSKLLK
ncbi:hypothetical protein DBR43_21730 [Pedobacter sp. KBW06]|nr:hypothetical protein DBR43_21730 [Pedobacter sp. KBW06]